MAINQLFNIASQRNFTELFEKVHYARHTNNTHNEDDCKMALEFCMTENFREGMIVLFSAEHAQYVLEANQKQKNQEGFKFLATLKEMHDTEPSVKACWENRLALTFSFGKNRKVCQELIDDVLLRYNIYVAEKMHKKLSNVVGQHCVLGKSKKM